MKQAEATHDDMAGTRSSHAVRPCGRAACELHAVGLSVPVAKAMAAQLGSGARPDFMVWGTVAPNLGWSNIAREVWLEAGLDPTTPAFTTVLACSHQHGRGVRGRRHARRGTPQLALVRRRREHEPRADRALAGPVGLAAPPRAGAHASAQRIDRLLRDRGSATSGCTCPSVKNRATGKSMGEHCEEMAQGSGRSRATTQDALALERHQRAVAALARGFFDDLVIAVDGVARRRLPARRHLAREARRAEARVRPTSGNGTITAGNSSPLTDGAAARLGRDRRGPRAAAGDRAARAAGRLRDRRRGRLPRGPAHGAGLRDPAPARAPRPHARPTSTCGRSTRRSPRRCCATWRRSRTRTSCARRRASTAHLRHVSVGARESERRQRRHSATPSARPARGSCARR